MSQSAGVAQATTTTAYAGVPAPAATAPSAPGAVTGRQTGASRTTSTTPGWLAQWRLVIAAVCVLASTLTALMLLNTWQDTRAASADTAQLVRVQTIKVNLLRADALATNAFLVGGLEPAEQRAAYDSALVEVERTLTDAAQAQPADRAALAALNEAVLTYTSSMELARANNRQGFPVGAAYLNQASTGLRSTALPLVDNLVTANQQRSRDAMSPLPWILVVLPGLLALVALGWLNQQLAQRFRRRFNVGIVAAGAATLVMVGLAAVAAGNQGSEDSRLLKGSYATVVDGVIARSAANDAKANESLRLISRGSGATYEKKWEAAAATIVDKTSGEALGSVAGQWSTYAAAHAKIVALDTEGNWDQAVAAATSSASGSSTAAFNAVDDSLRKVVDAAGNRTTDDLDSGRFLFLGLLILALVAGLAGAAAAWRGVTTRIEEYS
ncbi:hypothetical protein [Janibacter sp. HTCC2649]|uniref:hypothetical protein n=1 Tax=Janibacter sp. HTCC2649 TaxID=313589 RepID=UPI0002FDABAE|nr:hypothetical protein [Janibacter sp. HTCC2649]